MLSALRNLICLCVLGFAASALWHYADRRADTTVAEIKPDATMVRIYEAAVRSEFETDVALVKAFPKQREWEV